jgi:bla regulator protein blaR1
MIPRYLSETCAPVAPLVANHLWQSTIFAAAAAVLTLALRKNAARTRYWLWLAASAKFLVPFSLLVRLGGLLARPSAPAEVQAGVYSVLEQISQPFVQPARAVTIAAVAPSASASSYHLFPLILAAIWLRGVVAVLGMWAVRWRRVRRVCRVATPLWEGREVEALRRVERREGVRKSMRMLLSRASLEPAVFGVARPVLLWPAGFSEGLDDAHLEAILAHELCHLRRRDNLAASLHMAVEAIFWFHPLVWWLGARLVDERERACDEAVVQSGNPPQVYAESILRACEFCVESPLACASGVMGADLKKRIVLIMTDRGPLKLDLRKQLLLGVAALVAVGVPIIFGLTNGQQGEASSTSGGTTGPTPNFEIASIKPDKQEMGRLMMFTIKDPANDGRFYAEGPTLRMLLRIAYGVQDSQIVGGPSWMDTERFDIQAKADDAVNDQLKKLSEDQGLALKHRMLQALLTDRFKLTIHNETRDLPVYALVVAKNGPKLHEARDNGSSKVAISPPSAGGPGGKTMFFQTAGAEQKTSLQNATIASLVAFISEQLGRTVLDRTGLKGNHNFTLTWAPDESQRRMLGPAPGPGAGPGPISATARGPGEGNVAIGPGAPTQTPDTSGPSIFTALQEQLGLKLESQKGPVDVLVIDHAEQPSED